jgi:hypothetical protein
MAYDWLCYEMQKFTRGQIREDGKRYWCLDRGKAYWVSPERFNYLTVYHSSYQKKLGQTERGKKLNCEKQLRYYYSEHGNQAIKAYTKTEAFKRNQLKFVNKKYRTDPIFKLKINLLKRLNETLKRKGFKTVGTLKGILGCSDFFLKKHFENKFSNGMDWRGHTLNGWHADHYIPLDQGKTREDILDLSHYTNLQPLGAFENRSKKNKIL